MVVLLMIAGFAILALVASGVMYFIHARRVKRMLENAGFDSEADFEHWLETEEFRERLKEK